MPVMMVNLYEALVPAGADLESARKAAEEVANLDLRFTWMLNAILALTLLVLGVLLLLWKVFPVSALSRLGF